MKRLLFILSIFLFSSLVYPQENRTIIEGKISYLSSQNIYVKFASTEGIKVGDTLFTKTENSLQPVVLVKYLSSKSSSGTKINSAKFEIGATLFAFIEKEEIIEPSALIVMDDVNKVVTEKKYKGVKQKEKVKLQADFLSHLMETFRV